MAAMILAMMTSHGEDGGEDDEANADDDGDGVVDSNDDDDSDVHADGALPPTIRAYAPMRILACVHTGFRGCSRKIASRRHVCGCEGATWARTCVSGWQMRWGRFGGVRGMQCRQSGFSVSWKRVGGKYRSVENGFAAML